MSFVWNIPRVDRDALAALGIHYSIAYNSATHKVYVGARDYLIVFDTDANGTLIGSPRKYVSHPSLPSGSGSYVRSILVDQARSKLYLGVEIQPAVPGTMTPLVLYTLDANGEPTGTPTSYSTGNSYSVCWALVKHPTLDRLYASGWGSSTSVIYLDANGVPTGTPNVQLDCSGYSLSIRADGSKLYVGTHPSQFCVRDLNANGDIVNAPRFFAVPNLPACYLRTAASANAVYFKGVDDKLTYWPLDAAGEPVGNPIVVPTCQVCDLDMAPNGRLMVAEAMTFSDAFSGQSIIGGLRVRDYNLNGDGSLGSIARDTPHFGRCGSDRVGAVPDAVVSFHGLGGGAIGNRFTGLNVRATMLLMDRPAGSHITAQYTSANMSTQEAYLKFTLSNRHGKVYATDGSHINVYDMTTGTVTHVACANASQLLTVDDQAGTNGQLYVALTTGNVDIRPLDANGMPASTANVITTGMSNLGALGINSSSHHVYVCGYGGTAGLIPGTQLICLPGSPYFMDAAVEASSKRRVYVVSQFNANQNLWVWPLNADGTLAATNPTTYSDGLPQSEPPCRGVMNAVKVNAARNRLYLGGTLETSATTAYVVSYTLDANGDPTGQARTYDSGSTTGSVASMAVSADGTWLYNCGWGSAELYARRLDANGEPTTTATGWTVGRTGHLCLAATADGRALLIGDYSSKLITVPLRALPTNTPGTSALSALSAISDQQCYLKFVYSGRYHKVYSTDGSHINVYDMTTGTITHVACASAGQFVAVDEGLGRFGTLYVARTDGQIDTRTLDANGIPTHTASLTPSGMSNIGALCVHPLSHHVYINGHGGTTGPIPGTKFVCLPGTPWFMGSAIDPVRRRVYAVSQIFGADHHQNIWVWKLNADGSLAATTPTHYNDGLPTSSRGNVNAIRIDAGKGRLYAGGFTDGAGIGHVIVYSLDANGDPAGSVRTYASPITTGSLYALEIANDGRTLYECGWGDGNLYVRSLDADGEPAATTTAYVFAGALNLGKAADGTRLLGGQFPSYLNIINMATDTKANECVSATFAINGQSFDLGTLPHGVASNWVNLDAALRDRNYSSKGILTLTGAQLTHAVIKLEVALDTGGMTPLATIIEHYTGSTAAFFLPNYGTDQLDSEQLYTQVQSSPMRFWQYLQYAAPHAVQAGERPSAIVMTNGMIGLDANPESLDYGTQLLAALGNNTTQIHGFSGQTAARVHATALQNGLTHFGIGAYAPPSYFSYDQNFTNDDYLDAWADGLMSNASTLMAAAPPEMAIMPIGDEPGWYYPSRLNEVINAPDRLQFFRDYLQAINPDATFFGGANPADWSNANIKPQGLSVVQSPNHPTDWQRHLHFWTARFFTESSGNAFAAATRAIKRRIHPDILTTTNLNNYPIMFFVPSPNAKIANNPDVGPDSGMGSLDWFDLGRKQAVSCIWSEDWFGDQDAGYWPFIADQLRCAAREGSIEFGSYVVGQSMGGVPDGGMYKMMSLVGRGAKAITPYVFGPAPAFGDGWSDKLTAYKPMCDAVRMIGKGDSILHPGRPRNGTVAILVPSNSQIWDTDSTFRLYFYELYGLHAALIHKQYPVDFVDEKDIVDGKLTTYDYAALYVTAPNLSLAAQNTILAWVSSGHRLVLLPGAGMADEYNVANATMTHAMGATWGIVSRGTPDTTYTTATINITDTRFGVTTDSTVYQTAPLTVTTATALATFAGGGNAITEHAYGAGSIFAFGYWPGTTYWKTAERYYAFELPKNWSANTRAALTTPAKLSGARKHVAVNQDGVEGTIVESDDGIAVTLLNWTGRGALPSITITLDISHMPAELQANVNAAIASGNLKINSQKQGTLSYTADGNNLDITLPLASVDVLHIGGNQTHQSS